MKDKVLYGFSLFFDLSILCFMYAMNAPGIMVSFLASMACAFFATK